MSEWVLVILLVNGPGGSTSLTIDMPSKDACEVAGAQLAASYKNGLVRHSPWRMCLQRLVPGAIPTEGK